MSEGRDATRGRWTAKRWLRTASLALLVALLPSTGYAPSPPIIALDPIESLLSGQQELVGVAVAPDGTTFVSDRQAGVVLRLSPTGGLTTAAGGLDRPAGLALDATGRLLIAEEQAGRLLRLETTGSLTVLATGIKTPRWLAVGADGSVYVSAHRLQPPDGADVSEGRQILRLAPMGLLTVVATGLRRLEGLARTNGGLVAATKGLAGGPDSAGKLLRYPILADGSLGVPAEWVDTGLKQPVGLGVDALAAVYVSSKELTVETDPAKRAIGKAHPDARLSVYAQNLEDPQGVALGFDGSLSVADGHAGRLLRFRAPAPPALDPVPAFTNQATVTVRGTTVPAARVDAFVNDATTGVSALADGAGHFEVAVSLAANAGNTLEVFATTHGGDGLTSAPAPATVTHDDVSGSLVFAAPPEGAHVRGSVPVRAEAADPGSGITELTLTAAGQALPATLTPAPPAPAVTATATWDTGSVPDGSRPLAATARDRAGNAATISRTVVVDNTPPDTQIVEGPGSATALGEARFTFTGTDTQTAPADLQFAWRVDGGAWSAFAGATSATITGLAEGAHTFEVMARDRAGNEDPTPASRAFAVVFLPVITALEPDTGPIGTLVTIRGANFAVPASGNLVRVNGVAAVVRTASATALTTTVPPAATSGPVTVTTGKGTGTSPGPFTVTTAQDFGLEVAPGAGTVLPGASTAYTVELPSTGTAPFTGLATLAVEGAPAGVTATFDRATLSGNQRGSLLVLAAADAAPTTVALMVHATAPSPSGPVTRSATVTLTVAAPGHTALVGRLLVTDGSPLAGARLTLDQVTTLSDTAGNFVLVDIPDGTQTLSIDTNVARPGFPIYGVDVTLNAGQVTTLAAFHIMPPPPAEQFVPIANETADQVVTDPRYPGLSITLPAGVTITGWDGVRKARIALDRLSPEELPVPPPPGQPRSLYRVHFGTPMGGLPSAMLPISVPNDLGLDPGQQIELWYYDAAPFGGVPASWRMAGLGTVSEDGTRVVSDPGVGIERFCGVCGIFCILLRQGGPGCPAGGCLPNWNPGGPGRGEPVALGIGQQIVEKTDLVLPGRLSAAIHRTYNPVDAFGRIAGFQLSLGPGWALSVDVALIEVNATVRRLVLPGNARFDFIRQADGSFVNSTDPLWAGAVLTTTPGVGHQLRVKDGTVWQFTDGWLPIGAGRPVAGLWLLVEQVDRNGNRLTITRARWGAVSRITEPGGRSLEATLNPATGLITAMRDPLNRAVQYGYDPTGRLASVTDPAGGVTRYTYNAAGGILTITDARNITYLTQEYDAEGRVRRQVQADGGMWTFAYTGPPGQHTSATVTDPRGHASRYELTPTGLLSAVTNPLGQVTRYGRDAQGQITAVTDPLGRVRQYEYDVQGNRTAEIDATGERWRFAYEPAFNRVTDQVDPLGQPTRFQYDGRGNLTAIVDARSARTTLTYDAFGQAMGVTDPEGNTTGFGYDDVGNLSSVTDPLGHRANREHDAASRVIRATDPLGSTSAYAYDALNRLRQATDAVGGVTRFEYDENGNPLRATDPRGNATRYAYDLMDRVATRTDPVGAVEFFAYDGVGNLTRLTDRKGQVAAFEYDGVDRLVRAGYADGSVASYAYDAAGRLILATDSGGGTVLTSYDVLDRVTSQSTALGTVAYSYDEVGRRRSMTVTGQTPVTYGYDPVNRLRAVEQGGQRVTLEYDRAGRRTRLVLPNQVSTEYRYDAASRLTTLIYRNALGELGDLTYGYDAAGNRTRVDGSFARILLPDEVLTASYDMANRQLGFGDRVLSYDASGNLTAISEATGMTTFAWDTRNRLIGLTGPGITARFGYDALERRTRRQVNEVATGYVYDGTDILQEVTDGSTVDYLRGLGVDEPLGRAAAEYYLADVLGSTVALTDSSGTIATRYQYEPFGRTAVEGAESTSPFQYMGRENDGTGLYYYRARHYHPRLGRFLSEDPLEFWFSNPNLYAFVENDPINEVDPTGLSPETPGPPPGRPLPPNWTPEWQWKDSPYRKPGDPRWIDPKGGEWRYHPQDKHHPQPHWDYNPRSPWNSPWRPVPIPPRPPMFRPWPFPVLPVPPCVLAKELCPPPQALLPVQPVRTNPVGPGLSGRKP